MKGLFIHAERADRLQDRFEGTYSRHQILEMEDWFAKIAETHMT
jgi:hypothetical protein